MAFGFQPKSLDEILAGAPGRARRAAPGAAAWNGPTPLWAIVGEPAPFGWEAGAPLRLAADATPDEAPREPIGPEVCEQYYPRWSPEWVFCRLANDNQYFNCVRACVIDKLPMGWNPSDIDRTDPAWWEWLLQAHPECFEQCEW